MSFPRYPAYKDSGVDWLGSIPASWSVCPLKRVVSLQSGESITSEQIEGDGTYPVYGGNGLRGYCEAFTHDGQFALIGRQGALCGNINYAHGKFWASEHAVVVTPKQAIATRWMGELLRAMNLNQYSVSAAQPGLSVEIVGNLGIPVPSSDEQQAIASFLDRETAKIDALVAEQEQLITLLKEKRQAIISHAVTRGLDPSVPMKDSGVEWLGEVPAHWSITALKRVCDVRDGTHDTPQFLTPADDTFPFVTTKDLVNGKVSFHEAKHISRTDYEDFSRRSHVDLGDVLMPMIGSIGGAVLVDTTTPFAIKNIALFKRSDRFDPRWLAHFLNSDMSSVQFDLNRSGGVQGFVALGVLRDLCVPVPPMTEQVEIAERLSNSIAGLNRMIDLAFSAIATLQERRSALISAAVTGQIDVRGLAQTFGDIAVAG
jgi:type I restriction enzyme, S subunit